MKKYTSLRPDYEADELGLLTGCPKLKGFYQLTSFIPKVSRFPKDVVAYWRIKSRKKQCINHPNI